MLTKEIEIKYKRWSPPNQPISFTTTSRKVILKEEFEKAIKFIKDRLIDDIPENSRVYFCEDVVYPRNKFSKIYEGSKLSKLENSDVIVIDMAEALNLGYSPEILHLLDDGSYCTTSNYEPGFGNKVGDKIEVKFFYASETTGLLHFIKEIYSKASSFENKKFIDISKVRSGSVRLTDELYARIEQMIQSNDDDLKNLAMRTLANVDYDKDKVRIAMFMNKNYRHWQRCYKKKPSIETKTFFKKLNNDYPEYAQTEFYPRMKFLLNLLCDERCNDEESEKIKDSIYGIFPDMKGKLKIVKEDEVSKTV